MSKIPKLDSRDSKEVLKQIKMLARQYTPEWNFDENSSDFGVVFSKIFSSMMEDTINRYNKTAYNHYLTFLNMLGVTLNPAAPSTGMVEIKASPGATGVYIDKGVELYADSDEDGTPIVYQTVDPLSIVDTDISGICFTDRKSDFIGNVFSRDEDEEDKKFEPFRIYDNVFVKNLQNHIVYFRDDIVFDMSKTELEFRFFNKWSASRNKALPDVFYDPENVTWQYYNGQKWVNVDSTEKIDDKVKIKFNSCTQNVSVMGESGKYIRCVFKRIPEDGIQLSGVKYSLNSQVLLPDSMNCDDLEVDSKDFYPFGEQYNSYNYFNIECNEAFTKKGAVVEVCASVQHVKVDVDMQMPGRRYKHVMTDADFAELKPDEIVIQSVVWEYWNGLGWKKLECNEESKTFFNADKALPRERKFKFKCPEDLESMLIGSSEGHFIRARILKMTNQYDYYASYVTPFVHEVSISYKYEGDGHAVKELISHNDVKDRKVIIPETGVADIMENNLNPCPTMYLCLTKPISEGMIRIFVDIEEGVHRYNPTLKWEYLADDEKGGAVWKHIDVVDSTKDFSHSDSITFIGKNDFKSSDLFGLKGYFLRIINPDCKYSSDEDIANRSVINDIKFNAVKIIQRDKAVPEYFLMEPDEKNKVCQLSGSNISEVSVWIDEYGSVSTNEQELFLQKSSEEVRPEYNDLGVLQNLWVKWKRVPNLIAYGFNDRVYEMDYTTGEVKFGDGKNGKIPPQQYNESIKIEYSTCNGVDGNKGKNQIRDFVESLLGVASVDNFSPIMGGVSRETVDNAASRVFSQVAGGNRLVSLFDFEDAIRFNDRNIYKVKCVAHVDEDNKPAEGVVSIAVLPRKYMQGYEKFQGIKNHIWNFLDQKAPATLSKSSRVRVFEVGYVETSVLAEIVIDDFNDYQSVYSSVENRLKEFLDPVKGNFSKQGWDIGRFPQKEFIYNYLKVIPGIKWIKSINIFTHLLTPNGKKEIDFEKIKEHRFVVPVYGKPEINITVN